MRNETEYPSKVDWWIALLLLMMLAMAIGTTPLGIWHVLNGRVGEGATFLGSAAFTFLILGLLVWPLRYTLTEDTLIIRFGVMRSRLKLETITGVEPSHNPLSAPALSLHRLKVSHTGATGMALISPKDKERFMQDLASRCDHLVYRDGKVVPAAESPE